MTDSSTSKEIDAIIEKSADWRGETLARLRALVTKADPGVIEEVKWKKPSRPEGVPVWSHDGIICTGEMLKNAVRLTFPKGAQMKDPGKMFNTRLDSVSRRTRRACVPLSLSCSDLVLSAYRGSLKTTRPDDSCSTVALAASDQENEPGSRCHWVIRP